MRVLLINCPYTHKAFNENLDYVDAFFGIFPPLDLCWIKTLVQDAGHEARVLDIKALHYPEKKVIEHARAYAPDIIGVTIHSLYNFFDVLTWVRILKKALQVPVLVSGYAVRTHYEPIMMHAEFDHMVIGTGYGVIGPLLDALSGKGSLDALKGVAYRGADGKAVFQLPDSFSEPIDLLPIPDRSDLPHHIYHSIISKYKNFTIMLTSFSCPFQCSYCAIPQFPYALRPVSVVVNEMKQCVDLYHVREIDFFDATFTADASYVQALCQELKKETLPVRWSCRTTIERVDDQLLQTMAAAGCYKIYFGIESCKQQILDAVNKPLQLEKIEAVLRSCKKFGIRTFGFFMLGLPEETREDMFATITFAKRLPLDYAQFSVMIAKPNSRAEKTMLDRDKDFWRRYILGEEPERRMEAPWCSVPQDEVLRIARYAYRAFYFRPGLIVRHVLDIRSLSEVLRYCRAVFYALRG